MLTPEQTNIESINLANHVRVQSETACGKTKYQVFSCGTLAMETYDGHRAMKQAAWLSEQNGKHGGRKK